MTMTINTVSADEETPVTSEIALVERFGSITDSINKLRAQRAEISQDLVSAGIEADEQIKADLEDELHEAQAAARPSQHTRQG